jgi:hypothetical protein
MDENQIYEVVAEELQKRVIVPGVWTRAFAEAGGDNEKARALYIKYRVAQLAAGESTQRPSAMPSSGGPANLAGFDSFFDSTSKPPVIPPMPQSPRTKRHGCLLTWLLLMLVGDAFTILFSIAGPILGSISSAVAKATSASSASTAHSIPSQPAWFVAVTIAMCLIDVVAIGGVFYWKRWGFYASVATSAVLVIINVVQGASLLDPLMCLISPVLLYFTLRLGGENCGWRRLQ